MSDKNLRHLLTSQLQQLQDQGRALYHLAPASLILAVGEPVLPVVSRCVKQLLVTAMPMLTYLDAFFAGAFQEEAGTLSLVQSEGGTYTSFIVFLNRHGRDKAKGEVLAMEDRVVFIE